MINWEVFQENSSSRDAIVDFAEGIIRNFKSLEAEMWDSRAKAQVHAMRRLGLKRARTATRCWCTRNGYDWRGE